MKIKSKIINLLAVFTVAITAYVSVGWVSYDSNEYTDYNTAYFDNNISNPVYGTVVNSVKGSEVLNSFLISSSMTEVDNIDIFSEFVDSTVINQNGVTKLLSQSTPTYNAWFNRTSMTDNKGYIEITFAVIGGGEFGVYVSFKQPTYITGLALSGIKGRTNSVMSAKDILINVGLNGHGRKYFGVTEDMNIRGEDLYSLFMFNERILVDYFVYQINTTSASTRLCIGELNIFDDITFNAPGQSCAWNNFGCHINNGVKAVYNIFANGATSIANAIANFFVNIAKALPGVHVIYGLIDIGVDTVKGLNNEPYTVLYDQTSFSKLSAAYSNTMLEKDSLKLQLYNVVRSDTSDGCLTSACARFTDTYYGFKIATLGANGQRFNLENISISYY